MSINTQRPAEPALHHLPLLMVSESATIFVNRACVDISLVREEFYAAHRLTCFSTEEAKMAAREAEQAKEALKRAKDHFERASEGADDDDEVYVWGFYALENAVAAASLLTGAAFVKNHWSKVAAARTLSNRHKLTDVSGLLSDLNEARKGTAYGDVDTPDLDTADVLKRVESYIKEVEGLFGAKSGE